MFKSICFGILTLGAFLVGSLASAGDVQPTPNATPAATAAPVTDVWNKQVITSLTLSQASFNQWQQGGTNYISWQGDLNCKLEHDNASINWLNSLKLEYGLTYLAGQGTRKSADTMDLESVYSWKCWPQISPFVSLSAKSQFDAGFDYTKTPTVQTSAFLDPGYFTESAGLKYTPDPVFNTRLGFAVKETVASQFASIYTYNPDTGTTSDLLVEEGLSSVSELNWKITADSKFASKLDMFWDGEALDRTVVEWDNLLTVSLNKIISVNVENDYRYDQKVYDGWQIKETLGIGFAYNLL
jgi:hypothetical protein